MAFQSVSQEWRLSGLCNGNDIFDVGRLEQEEEAQAKSITLALCMFVHEH